MLLPVLVNCCQPDLGDGAVWVREELTNLGKDDQGAAHKGVILRFGHLWAKVSLMPRKQVVRGNLLVFPENLACRVWG